MSDQPPPIPSSQPPAPPLPWAMRQPPTPVAATPPAAPPEERPPSARDLHSTQDTQRVEPVAGEPVPDWMNQRVKRREIPPQPPVGHEAGSPAPYGAPPVYGDPPQGGVVPPPPVPSSQYAWQAPGAPSYGDGLDDPTLVAQYTNGAKWFYWIAGLTGVNSVVGLLGIDWGFLLGASVSLACGGVAAAGGVGILGRLFIFAINAVVAGLYGAAGYFSVRRKSWVYWTGVAFYALDSVLLLGLTIFALAAGDGLLGGVIGYVLRIWALGAIIMGGIALVKLNKINPSGIG